MSEFTLLPSGDNRALRALRRTWRVVHTVGKILGMLALGVGFAWGGCVLVGNTADVLTSDDAAVLRHAAETASSNADFSPRGWQDTPRGVTRQEALEGERLEALVQFGLGLFIAYVSLFGFAGAYFETVEALGFGWGRDKSKS
jgi:hypothetical protein